MRRASVTWWGKLLGGTFGFMIGGPLGAVIGAALGHNFDAGLNRTALGHGPVLRERTQTAFFTATFSVMGHIAKSDGKVSTEEIRLASAVMDQMGLSNELRKLAKKLFQEGKQPEFPLHDVLHQFRRECHRSRHLIRMFIEIQLHAMYADGHIHSRERQIISRICSQLGLSDQDLEQLESILSAHAGRNGAQQPKLEDCYAILGVTPNATDQKVKNAYRRLMNQHHPDKLVSKGLPEEMMAIATEKTQEIKAAYEHVMADRRLK